MTFPDWFSTGTAINNFATYLTDGMRCLQIGVFTGNASVWIAENLPNAVLDDVDTWEGSEDILDTDFAEVERVYDSRLAEHLAAGRVVKHKTNSAKFLRTLALDPTYDFAYIDGDHRAVETLEDAVAVWPRLKVGGLLAFDDYVWRDARNRPLHAPYPSIDAFIALYEDRCEVLVKGAQVWLRKTA